MSGWARSWWHLDPVSRSRRHEPGPLPLLVAAQEDAVAVESQEGLVGFLHRGQLPVLHDAQQVELVPGSAGETRMLPSSAKEMKPRSKRRSYCGRTKRPL